MYGGWMQVNGLIVKNNQSRAMRVVLNPKYKKIASLFAAETASAGGSHERSRPHVLNILLPKGHDIYTDFTSEGTLSSEGEEERFCMTLISLMTLCTEGKNPLTEKQCHSMLSESDVVHTIAKIDGAFHRVDVGVLWDCGFDLCGLY